nr:MAG TPA: Integrase [Caudoviricetes sp.]
MPARRAFGSIRKNRAGRFEARYTGPDKQRHSAGQTFVRRSDASAWLARTEAAISAGTWTSPTAARERERAEGRAVARRTLTLEEWVGEWLASLERLGRTPKTIQTHTYRMRRIVAELGERRLADITADDITTWYQRLWNEKGIGVVRPLYMTLSACMSAAVRAGKIDATPCCVPGGQKHRPVRESARQVATPEEVRAAADAMPDHLRIAVLLAAWCQTRLGEAIGLQRQDLRLDEDPAVLRVERQIQHITGRGPVETPPKSSAGTREVVIPASLVPVLRAHLGAHVDAEPEAWVLHPEDSRRVPIHPSTLRSAWEHSREAAGIPWFKYHDLRHTGLTIFAQQGATLAELLHRGGHSDVDVALRYQHATRERDEALTARMDAHVRV